MWKWDKFYFEGKQIDEKVLHFSRPSKIQLMYEVFLILFPIFIIDIIFIFIWMYLDLSGLLIVFLILILSFCRFLSVAYKIYRTKRNYIIITSKRIMFHWIKWLFNDYMKKIHYENIINVKLKI